MTRAVAVHDDDDDDDALNPHDGRVTNDWCSFDTGRASVTGSSSSMKPKFYGSSILADTPDILVRMLRGYITSGVSGDFPVQLATRLPDWSAGGLLRCTVLPICPCVVSFSELHEPDAHDLSQTSSRGCREETAPAECQLDRTRRLAR